MRFDGEPAPVAQPGMRKALPDGRRATNHRDWVRMPYEILYVGYDLIPLGVETLLIRSSIDDRFILYITIDYGHKKSPVRETCAVDLFMI